MLRKVICFLIVTALLGLCLYAYATAEAASLPMDPAAVMALLP